MGIKDSLFKKKEKEAEVYPETEESEQFLSEEENLKDFIADFKAKKAEPPKAQPKPVKRVEAEPEKVFEQEKEKPIPFIDEKKPEPVQEKEPSKSYLAHELSLYLEKNNFSAAFVAIEEALDSDFTVGLQAGVMISHDNLAQTKKVVSWLVENGYLVVVSGQKTERVLDE